jgi:Tfp pilus assembly protein PilF
LNLPPNKRPKQKPVTKTEASGEIVLASYPTLSKKPQSSSVLYDESSISKSYILSAQGKQYLDNEEYDKATQRLEEAIKLHPKNAVAYNYQGDIFYKLKRFDEAIYNYDEALKINPKYQDVLENKGLALYSLGRYQEAVSSFSI